MILVFTEQYDKHEGLKGLKPLQDYTKNEYYKDIMYSLSNLRKAIKYIAMYDMNLILVTYYVNVLYNDYGYKIVFTIEATAPITIEIDFSYFSINEKVTPGTNITISLASSGDNQQQLHKHPVTDI